MHEHTLHNTLEGFSRGFVVHSNTNPYAAAAAMGQMAARSQAAGVYFRPSENFVPLIGPSRLLIASRISYLLSKYLLRSARLSALRM